MPIEVSNDAVRQRDADATDALRVASASAPTTALFETPVGISLITPLHNERANLPELIQQCARALNATGLSWELILVDDGSDDGSWAYLQAECAKDPRLKPLRHPQKRGKTAAYRTGFEAAQGAYLFTLDADLQENPDALQAMLALLQSGAADMVVGWRRRRHDPILKVLASRVFNFVLRGLLRLPLHDANCGFKGMRREVAHALLPWLERDYHRYLPLIAHRLGWRVAEVEVAHCPRRHGKSRYGLERYGRAIADLWTLFWQLKRQRVSK
ncbi:MAG: glycosyltransferase family 2 protein [Fimbriimonadales bacterium]|nr:glycosyltransferase family 2 protein [Fimbriimonadales bacterium]